MQGRIAKKQMEKPKLTRLNKGNEKDRGVRSFFLRFLQLEKGGFTMELFWNTQRNLWQKLQETTLPIVLYGMGNGAVKLLHMCRVYGIVVSAIFASDDFVRGQSFAGLPVQHLADLEETYEDFVILVAFGSHDKAVMARIDDLARRHPLYLPDLPVAGEEWFDAAFLESHQEEALQAEALWADEPSRQLYENLLHYKWSGELAYLQKTVDDEAVWQLLQPWAGEYYWDIGAYDGDSIAAFLQASEMNAQQIIAWEPDPKNFRKLQKNITAWHLSNVTLLPYVAYHESCTLSFAAGAGRGSAIAASGLPVVAKTIDEVRGVGKCTLLKIDAEGVEKEVLQGAATTLRECRPKLRLAAYHRPGDLWDLPLQLQSLQPSYQLYLRRGRCYPAWDVDIIAL